MAECKINLVDTLLEEDEVISTMNDKGTLRHILINLQSILDNNIDGDIVELGCHAGTTSLFIQRMLHSYNSRKRFHVYDSFEGLPEKSPFDKQNNSFKKGSCKTTKEIFIDNFRKAKLDLPIIHEGWFNKIPDSEYPQKIAFAFFDGDFYTSIVDSFSRIYHKLSKNAVLTVHDYHFPELCDGVRAACRDFLKNKPEFKKIEAVSNLCIIKKE